MCGVNLVLKIRKKNLGSPIFRIQSNHINSIMIVVSKPKSISTGIVYVNQLLKINIIFRILHVKHYLNMLYTDTGISIEILSLGTMSTSCVDAKLHSLGMTFGNLTYNFTSNNLSDCSYKKMIRTPSDEYFRYE